MTVLLLVLFLQPFAKIMHEINKEYSLYPRWIKDKKNRNRVPCINDSDCPFPSACCNDPFFPYEFCCYGWNKRKLEYAYARQLIETRI